MYRKHLSEPWFTLVSVGLKTVEGRLGNGDFAAMRPGDIVVFFNDDVRGDGLGPRECRVRVAGVERFATFADMLGVHGHRSAALPVSNVRTVRQGVSVYRQFYSASDEARHGVVAVRLSLDA